MGEEVEEVEEEKKQNRKTRKKVKTKRRISTILGWSVSVHLGCPLRTPIKPSY